MRKRIGKLLDRMLKSLLGDDPMGYTADDSFL